MKYIDEFRDKKLIREISEKIREISPVEQLNFMEVCGTHTQNFRKFGLSALLPPNIRLISGPGCPVCVSSQDYIDNAIELASNSGNMVLTFGDMLKVPGKSSSLEQERAKGADVRVVYSPLDCLSAAEKHPGKKIIFLAVGFETTAPGIALSMIMARKARIKNIFFFSSLKTIPPAMAFLLQSEKLDLSGFLCPGHVSAVIGTKSYEFIAKRYKIGCCVAGFEPLDILEGLYLLVRQAVNRSPKVENQYTRLVQRSGNPRAQKIINKVFRASDARWRGLGIIPKSGLAIKEDFAEFDAAKKFTLGRRNTEPADPRLKKCRCGDILKGIIEPPACPLFGKGCDPAKALGPCMVSSEGACNAYFRNK